MAAFFQNKWTGIPCIPAPIAHEKRAVIGSDMLRGLDGGYGSDLTLRQRFSQVAIKIEIPQYQTNKNAISTLFSEKRPFSLSGLRL